MWMCVCACGCVVTARATQRSHWWSHCRQDGAVLWVVLEELDAVLEFARKEKGRRRLVE